MTLNNYACAFRAKKGAGGPLLLWSLMNDRAYLNKEDQARGQGDLKHAHDGVQQWAVEVVLVRVRVGPMGVPKEYVQYQLKLTALTRTAVTTPVGVTEKCRRASGLPQRGTHRPATHLNVCSRRETIDLCLVLLLVRCGMASLAVW